MRSSWWATTFTLHTVIWRTVLVTNINCCCCNLQIDHWEGLSKYDCHGHRSRTLDWMMKDCVCCNVISPSSQSYSYCILTLPCSRASRWSWYFHRCRPHLHFALSVQQRIYQESWFNQSPKVANSRATLILINYSVATFPSSFKHSYTHQDPVTAGLFQVDTLCFQSDQWPFLFKCERMNSFNHIRPQWRHQHVELPWDYASYFLPQRSVSADLTISNPEQKLSPVSLALWCPCSVISLT